MDTSLYTDSETDWRNARETHVVVGSLGPCLRREYCLVGKTLLYNGNEPE